jgi:hypothetical protein
MRRAAHGVITPRRMPFPTSLTLHASPSFLARCLSSARCRVSLRPRHGLRLATHPRLGLAARCGILVTGLVGHRAIVRGSGSSHRATGLRPTGVGCGAQGQLLPAGLRDGAGVPRVRAGLYGTEVGARVAVGRFYLRSLSSRP